MTLKNLTASFIYLSFALFLILSIHPAVFAQNKTLDELKNRFESGQIFHGQFEHRSVDSYTGDTISSEGIIWVGTNRYKVHANNQTVVVDGEISQVYDDNRNRVIISNYEPEEDDFAPSRILSGIDSTFAVRKQEEREDGIYIMLTSDDPFAIYKQVEIYLEKDLMPRRIRAVDPADNILTTTFRDGKFIPGENGMFRLNYPEGAEIIDMRNE